MMHLEQEMIHQKEETLPQKEETLPQKEGTLPQKEGTLPQEEAIDLPKEATVLQKEETVGLSVRELQLNNAPNRPLNPPFWGTLKGSEVPQNGGFRGLTSQCIPLGFYFLASP
jgi:hypothetical protein